MTRMVLSLAKDPVLGPLLTTLITIKLVASITKLTSEVFSAIIVSKLEDLLSSRLNHLIFSLEWL
jgi:hypothetical protein